MIDVECSGRFPSGLGRDEAVSLVRRVIGTSGDWKTATVSLSLVNDREIRRINRKWRGVDRPTDVLSFSYPRIGSGQVPKSGDVVISLETVRRQAKTNLRTVREELALMIVHGCLHLLGFDHDTAARENRMFRIQQDMLLGTGFF
ncbi:rRNA maturation RNase YbeY [Candidatus Uhrbacteria bacterium]|nr:rRNA maturation RNase YbeY [Candidatus Uhrbacteria bacterium]